MAGLGRRTASATAAATTRVAAIAAAGALAVLAVTALAMPVLARTFTTLAFLARTVLAMPAVTVSFRAVRRMTVGPGRRNGYSWYNASPQKALDLYETWKVKYPV